MMNEAICIAGEGISKSFPIPGLGERTLFRDTNLSIGSGELVGVSGTSGSGKTTLADILLGLVRPDRGRIVWGGQELTSLNIGQRRALRPRYQKIYQDPSASFPPRLTIREALVDILKFHGITRGPQDTDKRLRNTARDVKLDSALLDRFPAQLSGGEMQRFALARALLLGPHFLVADEPTSRLDPSVQALVARLIARLARERNMAVLFISHDSDLLRVVCDRVLYLENSSLHDYQDSSIGMTK